MKIIVTGATGFIGRKLVSVLLAQQHQVRILSRNPDKTKILFASAVDSFQWKSPESEVPELALKGADAVIHLAGEGIAERRWSESQKKRIYDSRILGTRNIVSAFHQLGTDAPKTLVCASAIGIYGDRAAEELTESSKPGTDYLAKVCSDWEKEARKTPPGVRSVSVRIGIVLGREGGALKKLLPLFQLGLGGPVGGGLQWMSWIHVDDLVRLLAEAVSNAKYEGAVNGVAPKPETNAEFARVLGKTLHRPAFLPTPAIALKLAMGELAILVLGSQRVKSEKALQNGFQFQYPSLSLALEDIIQNTQKKKIK